MLQKHFEGLVDAWTQWLEASTAADFLPSELEALRKQIEAHTDGLVLHPSESLPFLEEGINSGDAGQVHASLSVLMRIGNSTATELVANAISATKPEQLSPFCRALGRAGANRLPVDSILASASADQAAVILLSLAAQGKRPARAKLDTCLGAESSETRARGWQIVALIGQ